MVTHSDVHIPILTQQKKKKTITGDRIKGIGQTDALFSIKLRSLNA